MGGRGTDVARESAALVLLDDNFASIVQAVRTGRRIFDNLKKAMGFIFSVHLPIAGMSLVPVVFNWPLALLPVHILFLELIIDPACTIVFEGEEDEPDIMKRPPRSLEEPLFGRAMILSGLIQGLGILAVVLAVYIGIMNLRYGEAEARMMAFACMVIGNLGLIFANRSRMLSILSTIRIPNKALWWVTGGTLFFLVIVLNFPFLRDLFKFAPLHRWELALIVASGFASILIAESVKIDGIQKFIQGGRDEK
jgi:Ca2+-transporting ATPase